MDWVTWLFLYISSVVAMYGIVYRIIDPGQGEFIGLVIILTLIWPIWYPFYLSWWIWNFPK